MAGFVYYIPNVTRAPASYVDLPEGLRDVLRKSSLDTREVNIGPDNTKGFAVTAQPINPTRRTRCGYYPKEQKWVDFGKWWVGWEVADPPGPYDLQREDFLEGYNVKMCDDNEWVAPIVLGKYSTIQMGFKVDDNGDTEYVVANGYEEIVRKTELLKKASDETNEGENFTGDYIDFDLLKFAVELLNIHYRIGIWECSVDCLSIIDPVRVYLILYAAVDGKRSADAC